MTQCYLFYKNCFQHNCDGKIFSPNQLIHLKKFLLKKLNDKFFEEIKIILIKQIDKYMIVQRKLVHIDIKKKLNSTE